MSNPPIRQLDSTQLKRVLAFGQAGSPWAAADLAALWRHQLAAPIELDPAMLSAILLRPDRALAPKRSYPAA